MTNEIKWIAGFNPVGYLPETEVEIFSSWDDALSYLVTTVDYWWDAAEDAEDDSHDFVSVHTELHLATHGESVSAHLESDSDHGLATVFWLEPATE